MMRKYIFILLLLFSVGFAKAQFYVAVSSEQFSDTVRTCYDTTITYYAYGIYGEDTIPDMNFKWDFDDGTIETEQNLDTIDYKFLDRQAHRILVTVWNDTLWDYNIIPVKLGLEPDFSNTKADIPEGQNGICLGEDVDLIGAAEPIEWEEERQNQKLEVFPQYLTDVNSYSSYITRRSFDVSTVFEQNTDIDNIGVLIEHSNAENVQIKLTCPTGKEVVLKDTGGIENVLGEPIIEPDNLSEGLGYWYYWSNSPENGTMNTFIGDSDTIPSSSFESDSLWTKFIGCPLNGDWTLSVIDDTEDEHDGYVFGWSLTFNEDIETDLLKYQNIYDLESNECLWNGIEVNTTSAGQSSAKPEYYGTFTYDFYIEDDFNCPYKTQVDVLVEEPVFTLDKDPATMVIGDSVLLENVTSWAITWSWDFGDDSDKGTEETEYKKYEYQGKYEIIMTVTSESGCKDRDTNIITITPKPVEVADYNIFTPNGDGINDVFSFFNTPDELIDAANIEDIHGRIYNRNGEVVCKWETAEEAIAGWDGTIKNRGGRNAPAGYYYYVLIITSKEVDEKNNFKKQEPVGGTIYLYRSKD